MNIEEIKAEIERLQPEAEAAWLEFKRVEAQVIPFRDRWFELHRRVGDLKSALSVLEPKEVKV